VWREIHSGREWIVDADLKDFFGSVDHKKLLTLVAQRVADGRVLRLIQAMLEAGSCLEGRVSTTERGTPQGGVISPVLSNILLTPFDWEMRARGYQLTRYADDWVVTCTSEAEAAEAIADAQRILAQLGVQLHPQKTRIVHINRGFEFLGYKIKRGRPRAALRRKLGRSAPAGTVYAYPSEKSINRFKDRVRQLTKRRIPLSTDQIIAEMNPLVRGWGQYYKRSRVRSSSLSSMPGSCGDYGRIDVSVGAVKVGNNCRRPCYMANWGWSASYTYTFWHVLLERLFLKAACGRPARAV
jgi:RNA-directed DNA polymerase